MREEKEGLQTCVNECVTSLGNQWSAARAGGHSGKTRAGHTSEMLHSGTAKLSC